MRRLAITVLGTALALPLLVYATVGSFARYVADDFCWAGVLRTQGFFKAQELWYTGYSPRFAFTFLVNVAELAGPAIVPALPAAAIVLWLVTLTWTFKQFRLRTLSAVVLAEVAAVATLQTAPDLPQSLYWQTGMLTYLLPLVLATFLVGWIRAAVQDGRFSWWRLAISALLTFVAGGLSETYLIPQNVALTLAFLVTAAFASRTLPRRVTLSHLAAAWIGGVLALLAIVVAPSTASRVGGTPADLWLASSASIATAGVQLLRLALLHPVIPPGLATTPFPLTVVLCLALPGIVGVCPWQISGRWFALVSLATIVTLPFCYFPSFYAQNGNPPARSLIVPDGIITGYLIFTGYTLSGLIRRLPAPALVAATLALALVPIGMAAFSLPEVANAAQHAALWDVEDQQIRASRDAGQVDVSVPSLPAYLGEEFVTDDRQNWFNVCVARYYGVSTIASSS